MKNYIYGINPIIEALKKNKDIEKIWVSITKKGYSIKEIIKEANKRNIRISFVPDSFFNRFKNKNHQGVAAYLSFIKYIKLEEAISLSFKTYKIPLFLILDGVTDIRNFGAIIRSATCFNVSAIILKLKNSAIINEDVVKTSCGGIFHINFVKIKSITKSIEFFKEKNFQIICLTEKGKTPLYEVNFKKPTVLIIGDEHKGISIEIINASDITSFIPTNKKINSLNVSVATSIALYEFYKQNI